MIKLLMITCSWDRLFIPLVRTLTFPASQPMMRFV